jgi:hypothetical protein
MAIRGRALAFTDRGVGAAPSMSVDRFKGCRGPGRATGKRRRNVFAIRPAATSIRSQLAAESVSEKRVSSACSIGSAAMTTAKNSPVRGQEQSTPSKRAPDSTGRPVVDSPPRRAVRDAAISASAE